MDSGRDLPESSTHHQSKKNKATVEAQTPVNGEIPNLPEELIVEILARLPVKSLLRFRCVSKSWLTLISSQKFIKTQLNNSRQDRELSNYRIMATNSEPSLDLKHCSLGSLLHKPSTDACSIDYPEKHLLRAVCVVGSCNGLICIALSKEDLFLLNPVTRKSKKLPLVDDNDTTGIYNIGFGYNASDDDYKVVIIICVYVAPVYEPMVTIYSLKANAWKRMKYFKGGAPMDDSGKFASGKLHWSATNELTFDYGFDIVSLDMESELYGIVEQPNYGEGGFDLSLGVLGDCICVLFNYQNISADLWVLKEYGVKESWTKVATVPNLFPDIPGNLLNSKPLCMLRNGVVLFVSGIHFIVYNPKDNSILILEASNFMSFSGAGIYVESLVSPNANGS